MDMEARWATLDEDFDKEELKSRGWKEISALIDDLGLSDVEQEFSADFFDCSCVEDAIHDYTDSAVSIYTDDQIEYFEENQESVDLAIADFGGPDIENIESADDISRIQAELGALAWERDIFMELDCNESVAQAVLYYKAQDVGRDMLSPEEIYNIESYCDSTDFENGWFQAIESEFMDEDNLSVENLSYEELNQLAGQMIDEANQEKGEGTSYGELLDAYNTIGFDAIKEKYSDVSFSLDDFWCDQEESTSLDSEAKDMSAAKDAQDTPAAGHDKDKGVI